MLLLHLSFDDLPPVPGPAPEFMDSETAAATMTTYFNTSWVATPWRRDNEQSALGEGTASFASVAILPGARAQSTLGRAGNRKFFRRDVFQVTIATPKDVGQGQATRLAELVCDLFEAYRNGGLYVADGIAVRRVGNDGRWYRVVVDVPFNYHELK